jgi:hypothetical protein
MRALKHLIVVAALLATFATAVADDLKINQLEQDVRELKQQLLQHTRRIERLEAESQRSNANRRPAEVVQPRSVEGAQNEVPRAWLDAAKWERVRVGMSESDVLRLLGPPTTARKSNDGAQHTLFYAMELGAGSFLSGSVTLANQQVVEVEKPVLK